ncbi:MAG: MmgE/PrpD family protein [Clostridia bacterium]|nr:MmgE/PrpD family protein [Clostridia bacterium]
MKYTTTYRLEDYILGTEWDQLPPAVRERARGCLIDLMGALISGSMSEQFRVGLASAEAMFGTGEVAVVGSRKRFGFLGAATAMGHSSNAYDIDDGHNLTRAHPGTSFIGALLAEAYARDLTLRELLAAMVVSYDATVRMGAALMDYYRFAHSSGTFGAIGVAAGVGRMRGYSKEALNNVLSIAEFNAPLVPGIRSVEYPSMNKDGVPFGVMIGALALSEHECGFTGNKNILEAEEFSHHLDGLGEDYAIMGLYFKPYPCCRWAHPAIDACVHIMRQNGLKADEVEKVVIETFERATLLSKIEPTSADEAQYNIAYPVATAIVHGDFGIDRVLPEAFGDMAVLAMMKRLSFAVDPEIDRRFPAHRICRAEILTKDGRRFTSPDCEPRGEAHEGIGTAWLADKFHRMTAPLLGRTAREAILAVILGDEEVRVCTLVDLVNGSMPLR